MLNAQAHPPYMEIREAADRLRRERDTNVGANRERYPVFTKRPFKDGTRRHRLRRESSVTREQVARVLIGDRQRITIRPIPGARLTFEICGPPIVRRGDDAWMRLRATSPAFGDEPMPRRASARGSDVVALKPRRCRSPSKSVEVRCRSPSKSAEVHRMPP